MFFTINLILYAAKAKESKNKTKKLKVMNKVRKVTGYRFNTQASTTLLWTNNEQPENEMKERNSIIYSSFKKNKLYRNKLFLKCNAYILKTLLIKKSWVNRVILYVHGLEASKLTHFLT